MNTLGLVPGSAEAGTTVVTLLFTPPDVAFTDQLSAAQEFVARHYDADDAVVGITGSVPAWVEQGQIVLEQLPWLETVTVLAVFLIVAFAFRSLVAPPPPTMDRRTWSTPVTVSRYAEAD